MNTLEKLLSGYRHAMLTADADAFADLYDADGVHEFPFRTPAGVTRLRGRDEIRRFYRSLWSDMRVEIARIDDVAMHATGDPDTVIDEMRVSGSVRSTGAGFEVNTLVILTTRDGSIVHARDYMDVFGLAVQTGTLPALAQLST
jgi:ketosteroid isomerase-like protein